MCKTTSPSSLQLATNCVCCKWSFQMIRPCRAKSLPLGGARDVVAGRDVRVYTRATLSLSRTQSVHGRRVRPSLSLSRPRYPSLSVWMDERMEEAKGKSKKLNEWMNELKNRWSFFSLTVALDSLIVSDHYIIHKTSEYTQDPVLFIEP